MEIGIIQAPACCCFTRTVRVTDHQRCIASGLNIWYYLNMKDRVIKVKSVSKDSDADDVAYWMSKPPQERFSAVEFLRSQLYETTPRLQRVFRIVQREAR